MLKQSASRNQRYKGFKVKHVLQICALLALCIWLLNQVRNTYDKKGGSGIFQKVTSENGAIKLGRKDLDDLQGQGSSAENNEGGEVEAEEEVEESKPEESEDDGRGGGDDEIDKVEGEESEEVEDLIDEEDREKENQIEDLSLLEDQAMNEEGDENLQDQIEEQHKSTDDDASSAVLEKNLFDITGIAAQIRRLRSVEAIMVKNDEQRGKEILSFNAALSTNSINLKVAKKLAGGIPENTMENLKHH